MPSNQSKSSPEETPSHAPLGSTPRNTIKESPHKFAEVCKLLPFREEIVNPEAQLKDQVTHRPEEQIFNSFCQNVELNCPGKGHIHDIHKLRGIVAEFLITPQDQNIVRRYGSFDDLRMFVQDMPEIHPPIVVLDMLGQFEGIILETKFGHLICFSGSSLTYEQVLDEPKNIHSLEIAVITKSN